MKSKYVKWIYLAALVGGIFNAYVAYDLGNSDAALAWAAAAGMAGGAHAAHYQLQEKEEKDGEV